VDTTESSDDIRRELDTLFAWSDALAKRSRALHQRLDTLAVRLAEAVERGRTNPPLQAHDPVRNPQAQADTQR
jgi:hypothetical protein